MHGWQPVVRGGCDVAPDYEGGTMTMSRFFGNMKREMCDGEKLSVGWWKALLRKPLIAAVEVTERSVAWPS